MGERLKIGVSGCLVGEEVRHSGGHCRDRFLTDMLSDYADFIPSCPEVGIGMPVPREAVRLEREDDETLHMRGSRSGIDHTEAMQEYNKARTDALKEMDLDGYVFKRNSPSCGVFRVKVYQNGQPAERRGTGLFAEAVMEALPHLPVEEDGRLNDAFLRENFVERCFAYRRVKDLFRQGWTRKDVVAFHSREKMLLLSHSPELYEKLGQLVAKIAEISPDEFVEQYSATFMECMGTRPSKGRHTNALTHMAGFLKDKLSPEGRGELDEAISDYRKGDVPLVVPMTLLSHMVRRFKEDYLAQQTYLMPHPKALKLRNHA